MKFNFEAFDRLSGVGARVEDGHGQIISLPPIQTLSRVPGETETALISGPAQIVSREIKPGLITVRFQGGEITLEDTSQMKWSA